MGFGVLARLHKGAKLSFLRTKVNDEVWLPARVSYSGSARVGLVAVLRRSGSVRVFGLPKVLGRYLDDVSAGDDALGSG